MAKTKDRKIYYSKVIWHDEAENLQHLMMEAHGSMAVRSKRTFRVNDYDLQGIHFSNKTSSIQFEVTKSVPDQPMGTVPKPGHTASGNVGEQQPPAASDFLTGEVFVLVADNDILTLPNEGATEYTAYEYIRQMLGRMGKPHLAASVSFEKVAKVEKINLIHSEGVKSVKLNVSLSEAAHHYAERTTPRQSAKTFDFWRLPKFAADQIMALFRENGEDSPDALLAQENLTVKLELAWRKRKRGADIAASIVEAAAHGLVGDDEDGFTIVTNGGKRLTHDEIRLNKPVTLKAHGNSVQRHGAFVALQEYYQELHEQRILT